MFRNLSSSRLVIVSLIAMLANAAPAIVVDASNPDPLVACGSTLCVGLCVGDYDHSGRTNYQDFSKTKLAGYINQLADTVDKTRADFDCSGRVNYQDLSKVKTAGLINAGVAPCAAP